MSSGCSLGRRFTPAVYCAVQEGFHFVTSFLRMQLGADNSRRLSCKVVVAIKLRRYLLEFIIIKYFFFNFRRLL